MAYSPIQKLLDLNTFEIKKGLVSGVLILNKSGRNPNVTSASLPEDLWERSAVYSGFPTGAPEVLQFFSSSALDLGVVTYEYLATSTSTTWQTATVTLNGTVPVSGVSAYRVHTANYNSGSATTFNIGAIICRHSVTLTNIFFSIPIGTSQTYVSAYTIPFGSTGFVMKLFADLHTTTTVSMQGALWIRKFGMGPLLQRNFSISNTHSYEDTNLYLELPALTDITMRLIASTSSSAQTVVGGFDIVVINQVL